MAVAQNTESIGVIDGPAAKALTECMTVMDSVGIVRDASGMYEVTTEHEYVVDLEAPTGSRCLCDDHKYRKRPCKHIRRVQFEIGEREIPAWVDPDDVDDGLGEFVDGEPRWSQ